MIVVDVFHQTVTTMICERSQSSVEQSTGEGRQRGVGDAFLSSLL